MASIQTLSDHDRRTVARWALACAERVLSLYEAPPEATAVIHDAVARTRAYSIGESSAAAEISKRLVAGRAANEATAPAGVAAARAVAQAAAVAHMGAHALGAAAYAAKAVSLAHDGATEPVQEEIRWQVAQLTARERDILRRLPPLGTDSSGPLGEGLLSRGIPGQAIRQIQALIASPGDAISEARPPAASLVAWTACPEPRPHGTLRKRASSSS